MPRQDTAVVRTKGASSVVSRCLKGKRRDAMDEIEAWISDTKIEFGRGNSSRVSAQPPKNVTEQKMLESKLFEMSKQRYNFMLHSKWQQKLFMEKQRQKTAVMKDLLKNVDVSKIKGEKATTLRDNQQRIANSRHFPPPKVAMSEAGILADDVRTVSPAATAMTAPAAYSKKTVTFVTEKSNYGSSDQTSTSHNVAPPKQENNLSIPMSVDVEPVTATRYDPPEFIESKVTKAYIIPLQGRWPVHDDRFLRLHQSLSENYRGRATADVPFRSMAIA